MRVCSLCNGTIVRREPCMAHNWLIVDDANKLRIVAWVHIHMRCFEQKANDHDKRLLLEVRRICAQYR